MLELAQAGLQSPHPVLIERFAARCTHGSSGPCGRPALYTQKLWHPPALASATVAPGSVAGNGTGAAAASGGSSLSSERETVVAVGGGDRCVLHVQRCGLRASRHRNNTSELPAAPRRWGSGLVTHLSGPVMPHRTRASELALALHTMEDEPQSPMRLAMQAITAPPPPPPLLCPPHLLRRYQPACELHHRPEPISHDAWWSAQ